MHWWRFVGDCEEKRYRSRNDIAVAKCYIRKRTCNGAGLDWDRILTHGRLISSPRPPETGYEDALAFLGDSYFLDVTHKTSSWGSKTTKVDQEIFRYQLQPGK